MLGTVKDDQLIKQKNKLQKRYAEIAFNNSGIERFGFERWQSHCA